MLIGCNLAPLTDWWDAAPFTNAALLFRGWSRPDAIGQVDPTIPLSPAGYPLADASAYWAFEGYPAGEYAVTCHGSGGIDWGGGARWESRADTARIDGPCWLTFRDVNPQNPPRNLRVVPLGWDGGLTFAPAFLADLAAYNGPLRMLDWGGANWETPHPWGQRRPPGCPQGSLLAPGNKGVALEHCIDLANARGRDPWLCVPDWADEEYVRGMAELVAARLNPGLNVWVEFSNEVWNPGFPQFGRVLEAARADPDCTAANVYERLYQYVGKRLREAARAFVLAGLGGRCRAVLCGQAANPWHVQNALEWLRRADGDDAWVDALAYADYFPEWGFPVRTDSLDQLFADLGASLTKNAGYAKAYRKLADQYGVKDVAAYEGGQHLIDHAAGSGAAPTAAALPHHFAVQAAGMQPWWTPADMRRAARYGRPAPGPGVQHAQAADSPDHATNEAAQRDPRMGGLYRTLLRQAKAAGVAAWNGYCTACKSDGRWGYWGDQERPGAGGPKRAALAEAASPAAVGWRIDDGPPARLWRRYSDNSEKEMG